jgi:hypothetical protein
MTEQELTDILKKRLQIRVGKNVGWDSKGQHISVKLVLKNAKDKSEEVISEDYYFMPREDDNG